MADQYLRSIAIVNWGAGPYLRETWAVEPETSELRGSKFWPDDVRESRLPQDDDGNWDFATATKRINELATELSWVVMA